MDQGGLSGYMVQLSIGEQSLKLMPVVVMTVCSTVAMLVISTFTPKPRDEVLARYFD
jgi:hypothetical protein